MAMRKLFIGLIALISIGATSCSPTYEKQRLSFGSFIEQKEESYGVGGYKISYDNLVSRIQNGENLLVAVYPGDTSMCGCWQTFKYHIEKFVEDYNYKIYVVNKYEIPSSQNESYGFIHYEDRPTFHIVVDGKIVFKLDYKDDHSPFQNSLELKRIVDQYVYAPSIYEIDETDLIKIKNQASSTVFYSRSTCADCNYVIPNVLIPYFNNNISINEKLYMIDIDPIRDRGSEIYQQFKDDNGLSIIGNPTYGYSQGVVPTFQHFNNGEITSSLVYFNDEISKNENNDFYISNSFYTNERVEKLEYLSNASLTKILKGIILENDDVYETPYGYGFKQEKAAKYHDPLLKTFLSYYFKNN